MLKIGVDEAGRGPVLGPLILAGCLIDDKAERQLKKLGVKDSKKLSQKNREILEEKIKQLARGFEIKIIYPKEIDSRNAEGTNLNNLEMNGFAEIINSLNENSERIEVVVDCPSKGIDKWQNALLEKIENSRNLNLICENKADENHIAVAAASILAKCVREKEVAKLKKKYGETGSGYPSDPKTISFLTKNVQKFDKDGIFRKTWNTWQVAMENSKQKSLEDF